VEITDLIAPDGVIVALPASDKAQLLLALARRAGKAMGIDVRAIQQALQAREELGSTGVGQGVALPHCRLADLQRSFGLFARLERPIDFAAIDGRPIDLVCLLLIPEGAGNDHLTALALVSRRLRDPATAARLRAARTSRELYDVLAAPLGGVTAG
jgi:nitrogen PTS system EIIA component